MESLLLKHSSIKFPKDAAITQSIAAVSRKVAKDSLIATLPWCSSHGYQTRPAKRPEWSF